MSDTPKKPATKKIADFLRAVAGTPNPKNFTSVVVCAAGSSTRMEALMGEPRKQFMELDGLPVVARTLQAFEAADTVHEIIVVLSFLPLTAAIFFGEFGVFLITSTLAALYDLSFVVMQRFNRPRLVRIFEKQEAKCP